MKFTNYKKATIHLELNDIRNTLWVWATKMDLELFKDLYYKRIEPNLDKQIKLKEKHKFETDIDKVMDKLVKEFERNEKLRKDKFDYEILLESLKQNIEPRTEIWYLMMKPEHYNYELLANKAEHCYKFTKIMLERKSPR